MRVDRADPAEEGEVREAREHEVDEVRVDTRLRQVPAQHVHQLQHDALLLTQPEQLDPLLVVDLGEQLGQIEQGLALEVLARGEEPLL